MSAILSNKDDLNYDDMLQALYSSQLEDMEKYREEKWFFYAYDSEGYHTRSIN